MRKQVTMKDIAEEMDVSIVTISKALSGKEGVSAELRDRINKKAQEMGYIASKDQRKLEIRNSNVAIVVAERFVNVNGETSFYVNVYQKLIMALTAKGFVGILQIVTEEDEKEGVIPNVVASGTVDQVVVVGEMRSAFLEKLSQSGVTMVFFDFENREFDVDCIVGDNVTGGYAMTRYLFKAGYKNIGFVGNYKATMSILDRLVGFKKYKLAKDLPQKDRWIITDRDLNGRNIDIKLPKDMPDAFFCNCDVTAYRMITTLEEAGYKVPEDIAIVGYDDFSPQIPEGVELTTYRVDVDEMVRQCIHIIGQRSMNPSYKRGVVLVHGSLVERKTVLPKK
ncbi:MAG: LacI family DNA-binding transcriptional regulator [Lachnospiraceae bacterium]|nr:LacI family DNA-binding transcriptional regulator [Lachnospiraceae bacterium]